MLGLLIYRWTILVGFNAAVAGHMTETRSLTLRNDGLRKSGKS